MFNSMIERKLKLDLEERLIKYQSEVKTYKRMKNSEVRVRDLGNTV